jgi:hypothetical protein
MLEQKTLKETSEECHISMSTAFTWRHKILDTLSGLINADVNAAYQIIKAGGYKDIPIKENETVTRLNVA